SLALVGCKSNNKSNPIKTNRAKATGSPTGSPQSGSQTLKPGEQSQQQQPPAGSSGANQGTGTTTAPPSAADENSRALNNENSTECKDYVTKMTSAGWEKKQIVSGASNYTSAKLIYLAFAPKNSLLKNPVLMLSNSRSEMDKSLAESFLALAKRYQFDPIFVDIRGENCSEAFGKINSSNQIQNVFSAKSIASEIEKIREKILKDQAWKVWSYSSAGLIALRLAEQFPGKVKGLYLANFAITEQFKDLVQARIEKQIKIWNEFISFAKSKDLEINDDLISQVRETLKKENCSGHLLCGEVGLNAYLINRLSDKDAEWTLAVQTIKKLSQGQLPDELKSSNLKNYENRFRYEATLQITDRNADLNNTACSMVTAKTEIKEKLEKSLINSCLLESALNADLKKSSPQIQIGGINLKTVSANLKSSRAQYFVSMSSRSLQNPIELLENHKELMKDVFVDDFDTSLDFETFTDEGLLDKLR
ncbi:MAG: alpha/beta fold hydrolase, partial [Bdellovibrionales bacterium]